MSAKTGLAVIRSAKGALAALAIAAACAPAEVWACPTCKQAIQNGGERMIAAWQFSIVFMLAMPFTLLACFSGYMYYEVRKARARQAAELASAAPREPAEAAR